MHVPGSVQVPATQTHRWVSPSRRRKLPRRPLDDRKRAYLRYLRNRHPGPHWSFAASILGVSLLLHLLAMILFEDVLQPIVPPQRLSPMVVLLIEPPPPPPPPSPPPPRERQVLEPVRVVAPPEPKPKPPEPKPEPEPTQVEPVPLPPIEVPEAEQELRLPVAEITEQVVSPVAVDVQQPDATPAIPLDLPAAPQVQVQTAAPDLPAAPRPEVQAATVAPSAVPLPAIAAPPMELRHTIRADIPEGSAPMPTIHSEVGSIVLPDYGGSAISGANPIGGGGNLDAGGGDSYASPLGKGGDQGVLVPEAPVGYKSTIFEDAWVPEGESLLEETVRKTLVEGTVATLPDGSTIDCVVSPLALLGACGISNPKQLNEPLKVEHKRDNLAPANPLVPAAPTSVPAPPASVPLPAGM